jgi:hypothetical protein
MKFRRAPETPFQDITISITVQSEKELGHLLHLFSEERVRETIDTIGLTEGRRIAWKKFFDNMYQALAAHSHDGYEWGV